MYSGQQASRRRNETVTGLKRLFPAPAVRSWLGSASVATPGFLRAGLGDSRAAQLLLALQQAAEAAAGEMALVQLAAAAQDAIDAANSPEGDCPICMFPVADGGSGDAQKLPCFHCMHRWG